MVTESQVARANQSVSIRLSLCLPLQPLESHQFLTLVSLLFFCFLLSLLSPCSMLDTGSVWYNYRSDTYSSQNLSEHFYFLLQVQEA